MHLDIMAELDNLDKFRKENPEHITYAYQKIFGIPEGKLVLIDLLERFFEFKPTNNDRESGSQAVIIHIKNNILGVVDLSQYEPPTQEQPNAEQH